MTALRLVFAGTPEFAARHLAALLDSPHQIVGVFTQPDRPAGRGKKPAMSAVKQLAQQHQLAVFQPVSLRHEPAQQQLAALNADLLIVVAYGLILPAAVLTMPKFGCINVHGSLLPRWRGAAPIQRAIWAGDSHTGITIMQMNSGLDCGDILCQLSCPICPEDTSASLYDKLAQPGCQGLLSTLQQLTSGQLKPQPQDDSLVSYAAKLSKQEARMDWQLSAAQLERCVRAFNPAPVSYFMLRGEMVKVWQSSVSPTSENNDNAGNNSNLPAPGTVISADKQGITIATAEGALTLHRLQPAGKKPMSAADFLNSRRHWFIPGLRLD